MRTTYAKRERWTRWSYELTGISSCKYNFSLNLWKTMAQKFNISLVNYYLSFILNWLKCPECLEEYVWTGFISGMILFNALGINNNHALNPSYEWTPNLSERERQLLLFTTLDDAWFVHYLSNSMYYKDKIWYRWWFVLKIGFLWVTSK